jgi:hypothetical protein
MRLEESPMPRVDSSAIERIGYDEAARELHITFAGWTAYTYYRVPKQTYLRFVAAASKGRFFNAWIKDRYDFRRHARSA